MNEYEQSLLLSLYTLRCISAKTLLTNLGFDFEAEKTQLKVERGSCFDISNNMKALKYQNKCQND